MRTTPLFIGDASGLRDAQPASSAKTDEFAATMPQMRRDLGLSRKDLANLVGVSSEMIRAIEVGRRRPSENLEHKLREALS